MATVTGPRFSVMELHRVLQAVIHDPPGPVYLTAEGHRSLGQGALESRVLNNAQGLKIPFMLP